MILSKRIALIFILLYGFINRSGAIQLSDSSKISLLTCAPGNELYSAFGHNGIRVIDYKENFDVVFNYGTFDDQQPGFYVNFVKGQMIYSITYDNFPDFMQEYVEEKRSVVEQELRLTTDDKKRFLPRSILMPCHKTVITPTIFFGITAPPDRAMYSKKF